LRPDFERQQKDFYVLRLTYTIGTETYADAPGQGLDSEIFYRRLTNGETSVTSQINVNTFCEAFRPLLKDGKSILYIAFSSALSGTCQSAMAAKEALSKEHLPGKLLVVDSLAASSGQAMVVYLALKKREEGMTVEQVAQWVQDNRQRVAQWFTVDDLNFLKRGGRCSPASAFFGTMMSIKPVLHVDAEGRLIARDKRRGRQGAVRGLVDHMERLAVDLQEHPVFISCAGCPREAEQLRAMIHERLSMPMDHFIMSDIGPVIGSHAGPGTVALFFWAKDRG
jgi:DegV family protein with EDD domain